MRILLIDDKKLPQELGYDVELIARDFNTGIAALAEGGWDLLLLDHDLGDFSGPGGEERKGWHVLRWLARPENRQFIPHQVKCVSKNPEGSRDIENARRDLYSDPDQLVTLDREYMVQYYASLGN
ncbi:MAG TPA: cyclic-phosphate processing receiver domain-containing protein [Planktothrix sp.]|jgi:hypothetical protein